MQVKSKSPSINEATLPLEERTHLLKQFPEGVIAFDLETSGLSPMIDKIVEISAVKLTPSEVTVFNQLVNPGIEMSEMVIRIHGITNEMVKDAPTIKKVLPEFMAFMGDLPLIAHNATFDMGFIVYNLKQLQLSLNASRVHCSCKLARRAFNTVPNHRLETLTRHFGIKVEKAHRALDDALACMRVYARGLWYLNEDPEKKQQMVEESFLFPASAFNQKLELKVPEHLKLLTEVIATQGLVEINYRGGSKKGEWRPIQPVSLLPMPQGNFLYALCLESNIYKSYALHKIAGVREAPELLKKEWEKKERQDLAE